MDRRDFLKKAGLGAAALGLPGCAHPSGTAAGTGAGNLPSDAHVPMRSLDGESVSLLGYGCMRWPTVTNAEGKEVIDQEAVNELVDLAIAHGVNYFDSSPVYLQGESEEASARALQRHPRESYLVATKASSFRDHSFEAGVKMYRRSLEIYGNTYIDYYLLHSLSGYEDLKKRFLDNGLLDFLQEERRAGRIRHLGFSFHGKEPGFDELMALHEQYHWEFVQIQMNYMDWTHAGGRNSQANYLYAELDKRGIPIVIMEPLLGGRLADIPAPAAERLKAREPGRSIASWAFRFCGSFPRVLTILSGMTYREHLEDNLRTFCDFKPLEEQDYPLLEEIADMVNRYPLIRCTACQYCMPCPYGVDIPGVFGFYNKQVNAGSYVVEREQKDYEQVRRRYLRAYDRAVDPQRQAAHCIGCSQCVKACPQRIRIPREMRRIDEYVEKLRRGTL
ncbi:MAG: aldo/keto reductase [Bacteroidales bacterium]|nr:aldo/keto reductase [Bacteroidales bacterium]